MPELPEIEIVKRSLFKKINGAKIVNVKINNKNLDALFISKCLQKTNNSTSAT